MDAYNDILNLPHYVSAARSHMPRRDRAAQFSPFAALNGYEEAVRETARLTQQRIELDESEKARLNEILQMVNRDLPKHPTVKITYFEPDGRKEGGTYQTKKGTVKKIDAHQHLVVMEDGVIVPIDEVVEIEFLTL